MATTPTMEEITNWLQQSLKRTSPLLGVVSTPFFDIAPGDLKEKIADAAKRGDKNELKRLNLIAGAASAYTGSATGLPDLAVMGYNAYTGKDVKDLRTRALETLDIPTKATSAENEMAYNIPEYVSIGLGLGQLAKAGYGGIKAWRSSVKSKKFLEELGISRGEQVSNQFKQFMMTGQGGDNPAVAAALQYMRSQPKYAEMFTKLEQAATDKALLGMIPKSQGLIAQERSAKDLAGAVQEKLQKLADNRSKAGAENFTKAYAIAGDQKLVDPTETLNNIRELKKQFTSGTDEAKSTLSALERLEQTFAPVVNVAPTKGTSVLTTPAAVPRVTYDALGTPVQSMSQAATRVENIPGSAGYSFQQSPTALNVPKLQALLSEFGRKASSEDAITKGLSTDTLQKISAAVFGGLKKDLEAAIKTAPTAEASQALKALEHAREQTRIHSEAYNKIIEQGIPAALKGKSLNSITMDELQGAYEGLNKGQRTLFRSWVSTNKPEALAELDGNLINKFLNKAWSDLPDGTQGYDLGTLAKEWNTLKKTDPNAADMLVASFGQNAKEFDSRMQDALVFTRKMKVAQQAEDPAKNGLKVASRELPAAIGASAGYSAAKVAQLGIDTVQAMLNKSKMSQDQIFKLFLTPEGADFLKAAKLSPGSAKTLEALTKVEGSKIPDAILGINKFITGVTPRGYSEDGIVDPGEPPADFNIVDPGEPPKDFNIVDPGEPPANFMGVSAQPPSNPTTPEDPALIEKAYNRPYSVKDALMVDLQSLDREISASRNNKMTPEDRNQRMLILQNERQQALQRLQQFGQ